MDKVWRDINNKETKFRVFDRPSQRMLYQKDYEFSFTFNNDQFQFDVIEKVNTQKAIEHEDGTITFKDTDKILRVSISDNLNGHLMQFTGFYDRLGNEMWEGDIIHGESGAHIAWDQRLGCWCFTWMDDEHTVPLFYDDNVKKAEVCGNIYEDPELVK
jgi:hypothetical protein